MSSYQGRVMWESTLPRLLYPIYSRSSTHLYHIFCIMLLFFFFFLSFNLWHSFLMIVIYHQTKIPISFWCRWGLNLRSLIQPSETLPVELIKTHSCLFLLVFRTNKSMSSNSKLTFSPIFLNSYHIILLGELF